MELKEKLRQILKERYGIENDAEIIKEARALQGIDLGIFVNPYEEDEVKSAQEYTKKIKSICGRCGNDTFGSSGNSRIEGRQ